MVGILRWYEMLTKWLHSSGNTPQIQEIFYCCVSTIRQVFFR